MKFKKGDIVYLPCVVTEVDAQNDNNEKGWLGLEFKSVNGEIGELSHYVSEEQVIQAMSRMHYDEMTDEDIKTKARQIANTSKTDEEIIQRLKDELGYPFHAAIHSVESSGMRMVMGMMYGPKGNTISF